MYRVTGIMAAITLILLSPVLLPLAVIRTIFDVLQHGTKALKDE